jgi:transcription factor C subunit 6
VEEVASHSLPSSDHRYRPSPTFLTPNLIERLVEPPEPLSESVTTPVENGSDSAKMLERVGRAWAKNYGIGPNWQLFEDRSWFKESYSDTDHFVSRPPVYTTSPNSTVWQPLELK